MYTERRSHNPRSAAVSAADQPQRPSKPADTRWNQRPPVGPTCCGWCSAHTAALREKPSRRARILQGCSSARRSPNRPSLERHSHVAGFLSQRVAALCSVPEGRRRRLAGGKSAAADAAPGNHREYLRAPAGHRRTGPGFRIIAGGSICPRRRAMAETLRDGRRQKLLRCPAGAWSVRRGHRGPRPLARACPRLISCGVPPGRGARRRQQLSGGLLTSDATANSSRAASVFPGARLGAHRTSRSRLDRWDAADCNGCVRGFGAAAAGPRRTQPRSFGCGPRLPLCSSYLCGSPRVFNCPALVYS